MGSTKTYLSPSEAAEILGVNVSQVHVLNRNGYLEAHYPEGRRNNLTSKRFIQQDVLELREMREQLKDARGKKLHQIAAQALLTSRRVERRLEELVRYLGLSEHVLSAEKEDIVGFFETAWDFFREPTICTSEEVSEWAKKLLGITEEYLALVAQHTKEEEPWAIFMHVAQLLTDMASPGTEARTYVDHARRNLRNVAYFYVRRVRGARIADQQFPGEKYSDRLVRALIPVH